MKYIKKMLRNFKAFKVKIGTKLFIKLQSVNI